MARPVTIHTLWRAMPLGLRGIGHELGRQPGLGGRVGRDRGSPAGPRDDSQSCTSHSYTGTDNESRATVLRVRPRNGSLEFAVN
jgi:hypothetical protein